ncbi:MAG TPA: RnfABCDGE type electron transport complex subunit D [Candidatus Binatia bacterium]|nr:RnfABCDGE type electron transport complex subunit D [Candidatus Binatia bacterium]
MQTKPNPDWSSSLLQNDPRYYQIAVLSSLLIYGVGWLEFDIGCSQIVVSLGIALLTQYACSEIFRLPSFDPRSPLISGLSLCLLLRTNSLLLAFLTAVVTILSKFVLKRGRKHIFNPTNFGIVAMMLLTSQVWVSPAQWGSKLYFAFFIACAGGMVIYRAARSDVTYAFLLAYVGILFGRAFWLGDPWVIPLKQLQSGSLLLFAFYMISDPKTTPDSRIGRILFGILVATGAAFVQFGLYRTNGLLWSLAVCSIITPIIDRLLPGTKYEWTSHSSATHLKGEIRETNNPIPSHTAYPVR